MVSQELDLEPLELGSITSTFVSRCFQNDLDLLEITGIKL